MKKIKLSSILLISVLSGCVGQLSDSSHVSISEEYPPTNISEISILLEAPAEEFIVIGLVESHGIGLTETKEKERSMQALKEEAASIGANAVIITSSSMETLRGFEGEPAGEENVLKGKAIRYK
ncbi:MAG: hypothetical protein HRU20_32335 [Pseudomonadales bacterium]|nr:hypothetical protein [Pseudomonadales bacterium]